MSGASSSSATQLAGTSPPDVVVAEGVYERRPSDFEIRHHTTPRASWEKEEASWEEAVAGEKVDLVGEHVDLVGEAVPASGGDALRKVHDVLAASSGDALRKAAEAFTLIADVARSCPERAKKSVTPVQHLVHDVFVLRCLSQMAPRDRGDRDSFLKVVEEALGPTLSMDDRNRILHSHRKVTWGRDGAFLSNTQQQGRRRPRRGWRPTAVDRELDRELGHMIGSSVAAFLADEYYWDGESASDEAEFGTTTRGGGE